MGREDPKARTLQDEVMTVSPVTEKEEWSNLIRK